MSVEVRRELIADGARSFNANQIGSKTFDVESGEGGRLPKLDVHGQEIDLRQVSLIEKVVQGDRRDFDSRLIDILQTDEIDLVILNIAHLPLLMNILRNKKVIVDKEPFARHKFESLTMRKYFDFSIKESAQLKRRYLHG
jgi:hypothetical protein